MQIELFPKPPACRPPNCPWPKYPLLLKASSCPDEKLKRHWSILTKKFVGKNGRVGKLVCVRLDENMQEIPSSEFEIEADLVILAIGFLCPEQSNLLDKLGVRVGSRGKIKTDQNFMTIVKGVFCAGDMRRGQSLVVWAISEGRDAAYCINKYLEST